MANCNPYSLVSEISMSSHIEREAKTAQLLQTYSKTEIRKILTAKQEKFSEKNLLLFSKVSLAQMLTDIIHPQK